MMLNKLTTGSVMGRPGTPIGAWDTGKDDEQGNRKIIDLAQLSGLRRGMRSTGIEAVTNGLMQGKDANTVTGNAITDSLQTAAHPWLGPGLGFLAASLTGRRLDLRGTMQAQRVKGGGGKQYAENARAALEAQNPLIYSFLRPALQRAGIDREPTTSLHGLNEGFGRSMLGTVGLRSARPPSSAALDLARDLAGLHFADGFTAEDARAFETKRGLLQKLRENPANARQVLQQAKNAGEISQEQAQHLYLKSTQHPLRYAIRSLSPEDAMDVYDKSTKEERDLIRLDITKKIDASVSRHGILPAKANEYRAKLRGESVFAGSTR
jgi:hypothetical protein